MVLGTSVISCLVSDESFLENIVELHPRFLATSLNFTLGSYQISLLKITFPLTPPYNIKFVTL